MIPRAGRSKCHGASILARDPWLHHHPAQKWKRSQLFAKGVDSMVGQKQEGFGGLAWSHGNNLTPPNQHFSLPRQRPQWLDFLPQGPPPEGPTTSHPTTLGPGLPAHDPLGDTSYPYPRVFFLQMKVPTGTKDISAPSNTLGA